MGAGVFGGGTLNAPLVQRSPAWHFPDAQPCAYGFFCRLLPTGDLIYLFLPAAYDEQRPAFSETLGLWAFWLYNGGLALVIFLDFFPIGWAQLDAVYQHGLAYARSSAFYNTTLSGSGCGCRAMWCLRLVRC